MTTTLSLSVVTLRIALPPLTVGSGQPLLPAVESAVGMGGGEWVEEGVRGSVATIPGHKGKGTEETGEGKLLERCLAEQTAALASASCEPVSLSLCWHT